MPEEPKIAQQRYRDRLKGNDPEYHARDAARKRQERARKKNHDPEWKKMHARTQTAARNRKYRLRKKLEKINARRAKEGKQLLTYDRMIVFSQLVHM